MDSSIISRQAIRNKASAAFLRGDSRDSHNMNPSEALKTWLAEFDRLMAEFGPPRMQCAPARVVRFDQGQA